jgi:peptidoglycan hydrolase-like protein with peptidoglycan-binding domain
VLPADGRSGSLIVDNSSILEVRKHTLAAGAQVAVRSSARQVYQVGSCVQTLPQRASPGCFGDRTETLVTEWQQPH